MHSEYKLQFNYPKYKHGVTQAHIPSEAYCDTVTHTALLDLYIHNSIQCTQCDSTTLVFETARDRTLAVLILSDAKEFTVQCVWTPLPQCELWQSLNERYDSKDIYNWKTLRTVYYVKAQTFYNGDTLEIHSKAQLATLILAIRNRYRKLLRSFVKSALTASGFLARNRFAAVVHAH